jgi:Delta24(24(1))-sterol reductase
VYTGNFVFQLFLAWVMPGYMQEGLPVPSLGYKTLMYNCNALLSLWATMITAAVLHTTGVFRLTALIDNFGHLMSVAMIYGFAVSFGIYFIAVATGTQIRMSGSFIYDVFMGASLNPRIGPVDLKMWAEVRIPWVIVFFMAVSGACKQYELYGYVTPVRISSSYRSSGPYPSFRTWHSWCLRPGCTSMLGLFCIFQLAIP